MCEKANYVGNYQDDCLAWEIPQLVVETVENESVNRHKPNNEDYLTSQDVACRVADVLCPCSGNYEGQFSPVSIENGENRSLLVSKATFKCLVHASAQTPYPPRPGPIPVPSYEDLSVKIDILSGDVEQLKTNKVDVDNGHANTLSVYGGILSGVNIAYSNFNAGNANNLSVRLPLVEKTPSYSYTVGVNAFPELADAPGAYYIQRKNATGTENYGKIGFPAFGTSGTKILATTD